MQWDLKGPAGHTSRGMLSHIRHERSHIMYWNCGKNCLMSLSNVSRDGKRLSYPCRGSNCQRVSEDFCDVRSVEIANWDWLQIQAICASRCRQILTREAKRRPVVEGIRHPVANWGGKSADCGSNLGADLRRRTCSSSAVEWTTDVALVVCSLQSGRLHRQGGPRRPP